MYQILIDFKHSSRRSKDLAVALFSSFIGLLIFGVPFLQSFGAFTITAFIDVLYSIKH